MFEHNQLAPDEVGRSLEVMRGLGVPVYLRNAPTTLMKELGMGEGYRYAHNEPNGYPAGTAHNAWPEELPVQQFYRPTQYGGEKRFAEIERWRRELDDHADRHTPDAQS